VFSVFLPIGSSLVGWFVLDEPMRLSQGVALGLALAGLVLTTLPARARG